MIWVFLSVIAAFLFAASHLLDKAVMSNEMRDPVLAAVISGFTNLIVLMFASLFIGKVTTNPSAIILSLIAGMIFTLTSWYYYNLMKQEDVDTFIPTLSLSSIVVAIMSFFLLGESFGFFTYVGMLLLVVGAMFVSAKKTTKKFRINVLAVMTLVTIFLVSLRYIIVKVGVMITDIWSLLIWLGLGSGTTAFVILLIYHPHIKEKAQKGIWHLFAVDSFGAFGLLSMYVALNYGPASLVAALTHLRHLFTFVTAQALGILHPSFLNEKFSKRIFLKKLFGVVLIVIGAIVIAR